MKSSILGKDIYFCDHLIIVMCGCLCSYSYIKLNTEDLPCLLSVVHGCAVFLAQHLKQFAFLSFPSFVIFELPLPFLVCGDFCLFVILECPLLVTTHVPGLQQDLPGRVLLRHHVNGQFVILQDSFGKMFLKQTQV